MKQLKFLKINRYAIMALVAIVSVLLFVFGGHHEAAGQTLAVTGAGAVVLTDEEKKDMSEDEQKMLLSVKKMVTVYGDEWKKGLINSDAVKGLLKDLKDGLDKTELKKLEDEIAKLENALKEQGKEMTNLKSAATAEDGFSFEEAWDANVEVIKDIRAAGVGFKRFYFGEVKAEKDSKGQEKAKKHVDGITKLFKATKAAGVTSVANSTASSPANVTNPYSPFPYQNPNIVFVRRNPNLALNFVDRGTTNSAVITWTEEGNSEGDAAIVAEGGLKPLQDKKFVDRISKAKKVAGHIILTEEMEDDTPRIATAVRRLFEENVMRKYDDLVYADIIAASPGYVSTALDDQIDNADDYAAIGAAICQLTTLNATADLIVMNPADRWRMKLTKSTGDGQYLLPPFSVGDQSFDGISVAVSNKVAAGYFLVGESKTYKVDEYKPFSLRAGWQNDDLVKNQMTIVGEIRFHSYIATNDLPAWCYASYAAVKAQIEKP